MRILGTLIVALLALLPSLRAQAQDYESAWDLVKGEHDKNKDGKVTSQEYPRGEERFKRLDRNGDGALTEEDFAAAADRRGAGGGRGPGGRNRPERPGTGKAALKAGDPAPDFTLKTLDGKTSVTLSSFKDKKAVALIFGSYT